MMYFRMRSSVLAAILLVGLAVQPNTIVAAVGGGADVHSIARGGGSSSTSGFKPKQILKRNQQKIEKSVSSKSATKKAQIEEKEPSFAWSEHKQAIGGVLALTFLERGINKVFVQKGVAFPAQLAGCISLFAILVLADVVKPGSGESLYSSLVPGSNLLAKWFPVLFVPGLVMLPLAPSIGNGMEVFKFVSVAVIGLFYSMLTTAYTVLFLRKVQGKVEDPDVANAKRKVKKVVAKASTIATPRPKPYRDATISFLLKATVTSGIISILATNAGNEYQLPVRTIFFTLTTFASYVWGARLPPSFTKVVHPLIISAMSTLCVIRMTSELTSETFLSALKTYKCGTYDLLQMGAADVMMFLLGPSVVSFAISMFDRRQLLKENLLIVALSVVVSSAGGLFGTAVFVRFLQLGGKIGGGLIRLSTLSRNVTTALAIAITDALQGDVSLAILIVLITGVLGATICRSVLDALGIHDPVTRGLAVGGSAQGLGVTSMMPEPDAFPFAAMSMILTAISATVLVSIPSIRDSLVSLSQGNL